MMALVPGIYGIQQLTINDLKDYVKRTYHRVPTTDLMASATDRAAANK
jgi:hypothetical protein